MKLKNLLLTIILIGKLALADDAAPDYKNTSLTGDWLGERTKLYNEGVDISLNYHTDVFSNINGGIKRGSGILSQADLRLNLDGDKLFHLSETKAFVEFISLTGARPNQQYVGSLVQVNSSEPNKSMTRLEQVWIAKDLYEKKLNILVGLYDINTDFYLTNSASIFLQPSYSIGNEIAQTTVNNGNIYGTSTFPVRSLAARVKYSPNDNFYFQTAIVDALVAKTTDNINSTNIKVSKNDGAMVIAESGSTSSYGTYTIGIWQFSKKFPDLINSQILRKNQGYYLTGEKSLYSKNGRELFAFIRFGAADKRVMQIDQMWSAGLVLNKVFEGRDNSQLGLAVSRAHVSKNYAQYLLNMGQKTRNCEISYELTYSDKLLPWLQIQPDLQYIVKPTLSPVSINDPYLKNAILATFRVNINF